MVFIESFAIKRRISRDTNCPCGVWSCGMYMEAARIMDPDFGCRKAIARYGWGFVDIWMGSMSSCELRVSFRLRCNSSSYCIRKC